MSDRYDTSGNIDARYEPGSGNRVLANKLGITDPAEMDETELELLIQLYDAVVHSFRQDQPITVADLNEWHRCWLGNIYEWAGRYRTLNMGKDGFQFAASGQIARLMDELDARFLQRYTALYRDDGRLARGGSRRCARRIYPDPPVPGGQRSLVTLAHGCHGFAGGLAGTGFHSVGSEERRLLQGRSGRTG